MMTRPQMIVVGGGVMGLATGCALAAQGVDVTVLERYRVAHDRASSHGLTRAIRHEYGPLAIYRKPVKPLCLEVMRMQGLAEA